MSRSPVVLRERARCNIDEAVEHYPAEAGEAVALAFVDALEDTRRHIGELPSEPPIVPSSEDDSIYAIIF